MDEHNAATECINSEKNTPSKFGQAISTLRKQKKWTLRDLADASKIDLAYVHRLEKKHSVSPSVETLIKLAGALSVSEMALLSLFKTKQPQENDKNFTDLMAETVFTSRFTICGVQATDEVKKTLMDLLEKLDSFSIHLNNRQREAELLETVDMLINQSKKTDLR